MQLPATDTPVWVLVPERKSGNPAYHLVPNLPAKLGMTEG